MLSPSEGNVTECFSRDAFRFIKIYAEGAGTIKFFEFEAYNVSPLKIISAFDRYESYVPGFDEPAAEVMPPEIHVIDIYGDDVPKDLSRVIWSVSGGVPQGIELDSETGTLTVDPMASPGKLKLIARLSDNEDISAEFTVLLSETEIVSVPDYISYRKNVEAAPNHGSYPPSNAVDGNLTTRLQFLWSVEHPYITVDLGDSMEFNSITLHLMSGSMVKEATVRASDSKEELFDEKSIIGRMTGPLGSKTKVGLPFTTARYVTVYFDRTDPGVSILEFEVRKSDPAIIYAEGYPEKIAVSKLETVFSETPRVDVRDVDGASLVIDDGAYSFEAVSMPGGVEIDSKTGVVSVAPEAEAGEAVIRVYYINDRTIYNEYVIKITDGEDADEADSAAIIAAAIASFDIADYTDPYNTVSDFTLPVNLENGVTVLWSVNGAQGCLKTDETGFVKVTRSDKNTEVTLTGKFTCGGSFSEVYYQINVPGIKRVNAGGGSSGGRGSGGGGVLSGYTGSAANVPDNTENKYSDIDEVSWAAEYLTELADKKIMEGYDGKLYPSAEITREEFVKIIIKGFFPDSEMTANSIFIDIPNDSWCAGYVSAAVNLGLIRGISSDLFGQGAALTRQDAVVILERVVQKLNVCMPAVKTVEFADKADIADYARGAADTFSKAGIVSGDDNSNFLPGKTITRAEAAKMLCLTLREVENEI